MVSLLGRKWQILFVIFISSWRSVRSAATRNEPFCIDADMSKEDLLYNSERFKDIIAYHNLNNPTIPVFQAGGSGGGVPSFISEITLTRMVVDGSILPTTTHTMRNLRNWVHVAIQPNTKIKGLYIQAIKAPLGVPFGNFVIDFECKDCHDVAAVAQAIPTGQVVPCKGRPKSSARHPNALVVAGDVDPAYVEIHGFHFQFNWIEALCDDVPLFQFLIVLAKEWGPAANNYQVVYSPVYENEVADTWTGVPWPLDPTWKHNTSIKCHVSAGSNIGEESLSVKITTKIGSIIRFNEEYEKCITNDEMEDRWQCPPGPFSCDRNPQTKVDWTTRRRTDIENALKPCLVCNDADNNVVIKTGPSSHPIRKRESGDQYTDFGDVTNGPKDELDGSNDDGFDSKDRLDGSTSDGHETEDERDRSTAGHVTDSVEELIRSTEGLDFPDYADWTPKLASSGLAGSKLGSSGLAGSQLGSSGLAGSNDLSARRAGKKHKAPHSPYPEEGFEDDADWFHYRGHDDDDGSRGYFERSRIGGHSRRGSGSDNSELLEFFEAQRKHVLEDLVKAHSILMVLCWCAFSAISSYLARFHKEVTAITKGSGCFGMGGWLWGHTIFSYLSLCVMWTAVLLVMPYIGTQEDDAKRKSCKIAHTAVGAIAMTLFHFNHILGWYRPLTPLARGIYILVHVVFGYGSKFLAFLAALRTSLPMSILTYVVLAEVFNLIMYVVATFIQCKIDNSLNYDPPRSYFPVPEGIDTYDPDYKTTSEISPFLLYLQSPILLYIHYILQFIAFIIFAVTICKMSVA